MSFVVDVVIILGMLLQLRLLPQLLLARNDLGEFQLCFSKHHFSKNSQGCFGRQFQGQAVMFTVSTVSLLQGRLFVCLFEGGTCLSNLVSLKEPQHDPDVSCALETIRT